ncbi:hypothetical protein E1A91_D05G115600v1 [Gossypium mustelinum]|uniref:SAGA-associated factor 11 n=4 Tax=Gossypium TaxID=3633 RepID=A0A5J5REN9_GOSBA|nr:hypothetical protein ES319_D05G109600v1 [Gossypium barbadense]PPD77755.1 hypothetical protein GOBAR_DD25303 [Gossypium barbadense]TYG67936.1 hypothetical protein ES288_D05G115200v1 [Gossypium darwinii]TYH70436.1 hypothetical protein ES332_D05G117300v1 [Gossypium tomentosum]TYI80859.1 hypothetical protein E1A91_D05G115600v1 [Gossypium mustelinum]
MSGPNEESTQLSLLIFGDLLDSIIVDVASESHRIAKLGLDPKLEEEEEESHPSVASVIFDCMNCGRSIAAGRFAPHSEKCMGKVTRSSTAMPNRYSRGSPVSTYSSFLNSTSMNQLPNGTVGVGGEEYSNGTKEEP